jgi:hypothetical protein
MATGDTQNASLQGGNPAGGSVLDRFKQGFGAMAQTQNDMRASGALGADETIGGVAMQGVQPGNTMQDRLRGAATQGVVSQNVQRATGQIAPNETIGGAAMKANGGFNQGQVARANWQPTGNSQQQAMAGGTFGANPYGQSGNPLKKRGPGRAPAPAPRPTTAPQTTAPTQTAPAPAAPQAPPPISEQIKPMLQSNYSAM